MPSLKKRVPSTPPSIAAVSGNRSNHSLKQALAWVFNDRMFSQLSTHGNVKWSARMLVTLAVLTAWSEATQLTRAFGKATFLSQQLYQTKAISTFQGLMRALVTYSPQLVPILWHRCQTLMARAAKAHYRIGIWLPLAVDGSRFTTPRTQSNEKAFAAPNFGKGKDARSRRRWKNKRKRTQKRGVAVKPQIWLTLVWHLGLKLPWCWASGPSTSSERHHLRDMIATYGFPENTLFCGDSGFVGDSFWKAIIQSGHHFLVRVGGNIRLLKNLGHAKTKAGIVYFWTHRAKRQGQAPIILRLIEIKGSQGSMFLVTNVLDANKLSHATIKKLYLMRWGIELQFRSIKQTFGRGKLRCRNSQHALVELDWSLIALTIVQLRAVYEQNKLKSAPEKMSVALVLNAIRIAMDYWGEREQKANRLPKCLKAATRDAYQRRSSKQAKYQPQPKEKPKTTEPIVQEANKKLKLLYRKLIRKK